MTIKLAFSAVEYNGNRGDEHAVIAHVEGAEPKGAITLVNPNMVSLLDLSQRERQILLVDSESAARALRNYATDHDVNICRITHPDLNGEELFAVAMTSIYEYDALGVPTIRDLRDNPDLVAIEISNEWIERVVVSEPGIIYDIIEPEDSSNDLGM